MTGGGGDGLGGGTACAQWIPNKVTTRNGFDMLEPAGVERYAGRRG